jgi:MoxR-like ATPase
MRKLSDGILSAVPESGIAPYVFTEEMIITIDVVLAIDRPLLISGNPGCGKSRLADAMAEVLGWRLLSRTITSRTRLETLTAEVDQVRRLNDAQTHRDGAALRPDGWYLNPGIFWWAFDAESAARRGLVLTDEETPGARLAFPDPRQSAQPDPCRGVVLLIDEIDKAEPDLPNDLLEPLDRRRFDLPDGFGITPKSGGEQTFIEAPRATSCAC